jgi:hypothetical protein
LQMANPWTKKNPFMSLWLSGANRVASQARGQVKASATKQQSALATQTARFWASAWLVPIKPKRRRVRVPWFGFDAAV